MERVSARPVRGPEYTERGKCSTGARRGDRVTWWSWWIHARGMKTRQEGAYVLVELAGVRFVGAASPSGYKSRCTAHMSSVGVEFVLKKRRSCAGTTASTVSFFFLRSSSFLCHSSAAERGESATVRRRARARHQQKLLSCWQYKFVTYTIFSLIHQTF